MTNSAGKYQEISVPVKVTPQTTVAPTAITLDVTGIKTLKKGKTIPVTVTLTPTTAVSAITWEIADPAVASIDDQGSVKGLKVGTTKIIAKTANGKSTNFTLRVTN